MGVDEIYSEDFYNSLITEDGKVCKIVDIQGISIDKVLEYRKENDRLIIESRILTPDLETLNFLKRLRGIG